MNALRPALTLTLLFTVLTGAIYPLVVTGLSQLVFPRAAHGSLIERDGRVIGSVLIAQDFASDRYFHARPSAAGEDYDAAASSGSNLGPTSKALLASIRERTAALQPQHPGAPVPLDLVTASASGLDPHLSPEAARFQAARVAKARGVTEDEVLHLVRQHTGGRTLGVLGEPRVNVLELNLALDARWHAPPRANPL